MNGKQRRQYVSERLNGGVRRAHYACQVRLEGLLAGGRFVLSRGSRFFFWSIKKMKNSYTFFFKWVFLHVWELQVCDAWVGVQLVAGSDSYGMYVDGASFKENNRPGDVVGIRLNQ